MLFYHSNNLVTQKTFSRVSNKDFQDSNYPPLTIKL